MGWEIGFLKFLKDDEDILVFNIRYDDEGE